VRVPILCTLLPTLLDDQVADDSLPKSSLPHPPIFGKKGQDNGDSFDRWLRKPDCHAAPQRWSPCEKLLQFELRLMGKAEQRYEVLPADVKTSQTQP